MLLDLHYLNLMLTMDFNRLMRGKQGMLREQKIVCSSTLNHGRRGAKAGLNTLVCMETYLISSVEIFHALMSVAFYVAIVAQGVVWKPVAVA